MLLIFYEKLLCNIIFLIHIDKYCLKNLIITVIVIFEYRVYRWMTVYTDRCIQYIQLT